ncbi:MAG: 3-hydroxyacyl-CoA dehydrogenase NAD-binding domain-containing protein [Methylococcaceae bacterium]|nr:3-hydroxyacyl-CoA dehydrogenase NAD-binding domain-containing protein [Methylococcaceae bacterium]MCI0732745.1 3-hydroxyacyl-CoA dehydrogenase NAD-binding domain-containing protein [Methylococcaceae bacterium]
MNEFAHFRLEKGRAGLVWLVFDNADGETNVLSSAVLEELKGLLQQMEIEKPAGLAIRSAKPNGFIAGADVKEFTGIKNFEDAHRLISRGQEVMNRIEALPFPSVAVIHGFCLGGGLELALSCRYRIALDDPGTRIGLPEIKLGIHPGFGGSVRSIRLIGPLAAMDLMLTGRTVAAQQARKIGLVDYAVPERLLLQSAEQVLLQKPAPKRPKFRLRILNHQPLRSLVAAQMVKQVSREAAREHYPAPYALVDLWRKFGGNTKKFMAEEANSVAVLSTHPSARNLVRVFLLQDLLKSGADKSKISPRHVHVIGAGVMGGDIAAWCAAQGFQVTVQDTYKAGLAKAMQRADRFLQKRFRGKQHLVNKVMDRLVPDARGLGVAKADVIIEAIYEDAGAKRALYRDLEPEAKSDALIATNTSSIRLEELADVMQDPSRLVGLHFFNPVAKMPLVEVVRGEHTSNEVIDRARAFARHLDKLPVTVASSPGFLVNRVLMPYLVEAVGMLDEGVPKSVVDRAAKDFGMPMGPIRLADTVGLDVCLFVAGILSKDLGLKVPERLRQMVEKGLLGVKSGQGFYSYKRGKPVKEAQTPYSGDVSLLQSRLVNRLTGEAQACLREKVVESADLLDAGIVFGTGFAPFTGGPLNYLEQQEAASDK